MLVSIILAESTTTGYLRRGRVSCRRRRRLSCCHPCSGRSSASLAHVYGKVRDEVVPPMSNVLGTGHVFRQGVDTNAS